jgi:sortase A
VTLLLAGAVSLATALFGYLQGSLWQRAHAEDVLPGVSPFVAAPGPRPGSVVARLRITRLSLDLPVIEGTSAADLLKSPGHLIGSALPGQPQNCVLAGHRDLHFRRLGELRPGDPVELVTGQGTYIYRVEEARAIDPSETSILEPGAEARLTLITCYPFHYVGPAPKRYVVVGRMASAGSGQLSFPPSR